MLKTLGAQVKQYRWVTFITPVFSALEAVADMFLPMLMSRIIDKGVKVGGQAGMQAVLHYGAIMVAVAIGALVCGILAGRFLLPDAAVAHCGTVIRSLRRASRRICGRPCLPTSRAFRSRTSTASPRRALLRA